MSSKESVKASFVAPGMGKKMRREVENLVFCPIIIYSIFLKEVKKIVCCIF